MPKLVKGLQILNQADPCAEYIVQETGEHVILTAGELHLEVRSCLGKKADMQRCLKDLRERFAKCPIQRSQAIVPFRETAVKGIDMAPPKTKDAPRGTIHGSLFNGLVTYTIRALPLPEPVTDFLSVHTATIANLQTRTQGDSVVDYDEMDASDAQGQARMLAPEQFWTELEGLFRKAGPEWTGAADRIWTFGSKRVGPNVLLDPEGKSKLRQVPLVALHC